MVTEPQSLEWLFFCPADSTRAISRADQWNPADFILFYFEVENSLCGRLVAKYCSKGGLGCSGYLYTFVLLSCVGCAYSGYEYGGTESASLLLELPLKKFSSGNQLHLWV